MREHVIISYCDMHALAGDRDVRATQEVTMTVGAIIGARTVDLCTSCYDNYVAPLVPAMDEYGVAQSSSKQPQRAGTAAKKSPSMEPDPGKCMLCGSSFQWLSAHLATGHGVKTDDARGDDGQYHCPVCDYTSATGRALAVHTTQAHQQRLPRLLGDLRAQAIVAEQQSAPAAAKRSRGRTAKSA